MRKALSKGAAAITGGMTRRARRLRTDHLCTWLYHLLRIGIGGIFLYAGWVKLLDPKAFAHSLAQFGLVPDGLLPVVAMGLPALELLAGLGLIFEVRGSLTTISGLLIMFLAVLTYAILMELNIDCGCFSQEEIDAQHGLRTALGRDFFLITAMLFLFRRRRSLSSRAGGRKESISRKGEGNTW